MGFARFTAIGLHYGAHLALDQVDLAIPRGEIFCLLGASGSGKTSLLKIAGGFLAPNSGRVELDGVDITASPPWQRPVNTMFQSYALFPHMSVAENIGFGLRRQGVRGAVLAARVAELLALVRLDGFANRAIAQLSGGQQQRVALARSLARRPKLLLLDEPFSALDRNLREETRADLLTLLRGLAITCIIVTHDQDEALSIADRIGVLRAGRLEQVGTPAELYERPANRYVAEFLGAANLLPARVLAAGPDGVDVLLAGDARARVPGMAEAGRDLLLGLRPEWLQPADAPGPNVLHGVVESRVFRGATLDIRLRLADGSTLRLAWPARAAAPAIGAALAVRFDTAMLLAP